MITTRSRLEGVYIPLVVLTIGFLLVALQYWFMKFDVVSAGDPEWYWQDSLRWWTPFNVFHVPAYALLIALVRSVTFGVLPPAVVMDSITWASLLLGAWAVYYSIKRSGIAEGYAVLGACLYGLWPCVGLVSIVFPHADGPALAVLLLGLLALQSSRPRTAAVLFGLALVFHKANWLFVALILLAEILRGKGRLLRDWAVITALVLPLALTWFFGALYHHSPLWIFSTSLDVGVQTRKTFPLLGGIIGSVSAGGLKSVFKGGLVVGLTTMAAALLVWTFRKKAPNWPYGLALSAGCLFFFLFLTLPEIWAAVRFSRLLVLPLAWNMAGRPARRTPARLAAAVLLLLALLLSQFLFASYSARVFYGENARAERKAASAPEM